MSSPFPGMDPFLETNPIFQELHTQMLAEMQALLQPQLRPKYVARLERHLSEGSVWDASEGMISLERKEPDVTIVSRSAGRKQSGSIATLALPAATSVENLDTDELERIRRDGLPSLRARSASVSRTQEASTLAAGKYSHV